MKLGIVGLPNVGKSTLFNAITNAGAESANYPFCTIDPNVGMVTVPDSRLSFSFSLLPQAVSPRDRITASSTALFPDLCPHHMIGYLLVCISL